MLPRELSELYGNPHHQKNSTPVVEVVAGKALPPTDLSEQELNAWELIWEIASSYLLPLNGHTVYRYIKALTDYAALRDKVAEHGYLVMSTKLTLMPNPAVKMLRDTEALLSKYERDLALSPMARTHLGFVAVSAKKEERKLDAFTRGR